MTGSSIQWKWYEDYDGGAWNALVAVLPGAHFLQSWEWGQVKRRYGWKPWFHLWERDGSVVAGTLILQRTLAFKGFVLPLSVIYLPKGPLMDWQDAPLCGRVLSDLALFTRQVGGIFVKIDPDIVLGTGIPGSGDAISKPLGETVQDDLRRRGWRYSQSQIQFRNTVLVDLTPEPEQMLARMKQKTRYNIRLAEKKGVRVRVGLEQDLEMLYRMYAETSLRDGFAIRSESYYRDVWTTFMRAGMAEPLIAEVDGAPAAAVVIFRFAGRAYYFYGMSGEQHREKMPNHLLQWQAMLRARENGCTIYDFWGAPEVFAECDSMWGVFRFKDGFGGTVVRTLGAWDLPARPTYYRLYCETLPRLLDVMRRRGIASIRKNVQENMG